ncbi:MAG TPA: hypothetical protein VIR33_18975 [Thermopolyspora sp.]|jgi:Endodeoxyribonuclease RusA.
MTGPRTWTIELPAGMELLTSNNRSGHWGHRHRITKSIVGTTIVIARAAKIPPLGRVTISAVWHPPAKGRAPVRDAHNLAPTLKACIDGIVRAGVLRDDSDTYVASAGISPGEKREHGQFVVHITEATDDATEVTG